jgi:starch synthase (maltosyl-transferring)
MDQILPSAATPKGHDVAERPSPRIFYVNPLAIGPIEAWKPVVAHAAAMGFTHILTAPPFAGPGIMLPADFIVAHPCLATPLDAPAAIRRIVEMCRSQGVALLLDVVPDRVAAGGGIAAARPDLFCGPRDGGPLDPRHFPPQADAAIARFDTAADGLAGWWSEHLALWRDAGVSGFRLTTLAGIPPGFVRALADRKPGLLLGWTIGLPPADLALFEGSGLDGTFLSLPPREIAWDALWADVSLLRRIAPAIASVETPFGPRVAGATHDAALLAPIQARAAALAAAFGDGWLMPMGFERGERRAMERNASRTAGRSIPLAIDISDAVKAANAAASRGDIRPLATQAQGGIAFLRSAIDPRYADSASLTLVNTDPMHRRTVPLGPLLEAAGGRFEAQGVSDSVTLGPAGVTTLALRELPPILLSRPALAHSAATAARAPRVGIERIAPSVENGLFPAKRGAGEVVAISCDLLCDGHDKLSAVVLWREADSDTWHEIRMQPVGNDRWSADIALRRVGRNEFMIEAWRDVFASYRDELTKKHAAGLDLRLELMEGRELVSHADAAFGARLAALEPAEQVPVLLSVETAALMAKADERQGAARTPPHAIDADRLAARFASWYEIFPRSMSDDPDRHGTFRDVIRHLPRIRDMGFDVLYFPPIHPIGVTNRKGRNNALKAAEGDVGSPYAIGGAEGGHDALHPELGTFEDFQALRAAAEAHGLELALDFAIQCSPDHPWLKQHHDWFAWRPDGSMKYAENPPKKYEDIVNVDFYAEASIPSLWVALCEVVMFWAGQGVRIIRVDNPHTKPFPFWQWMIAEVRARYPDMLFLAEAFTRPKIMNRLGKIGFSQSYTYFTWRNSKAELQDYLTELTTGDMPDFFRPNFFVNTPDINPPFLQTSGRPGHLIRAALAATLSGLWGVYSGFELCDATPLPGREEYLDSEKYQIRAWDWRRPGNIVAEIAALNLARRMNPALQSHLGLTFLPADNDQIMLYEKASPDRSNVVIVAVSLDPANPQSANIELPLWKFGLADSATLAARDLMTGHDFVWQGKWQRVGLNPAAPFALWRVRPAF